MTHPIIAREGWPYIAAALVLSLFANHYGGWIAAIPFWALTLFVLQFFRDPPRRIPSDPDLVLAPADGRIVSVMEARDPYLNRDAAKVSVFMNVFNVHSNRSPAEGQVQNTWYHPGKFVNASFDKASAENERNAIWIRTPHGVDITCVQVAGLVARRIFCYVSKGDLLGRGQRYGFIRFGSRVDVYLPRSARIKARIGDKVYAAETVLAQL